MSTNRFTQERETVLIWGLGYIGLTSFLTITGSDEHDVYGYDPNSRHVAALKEGKVVFPGALEQVPGCSRDALMKRAVSIVDNLSDVPTHSVSAHFIDVPTEKGDAVDYSALSAVVADLAKILSPRSDDERPVILLCESTISRGITQREIIAPLERTGLKLGRDFHVAISPRRDVFGGRYFAMNEQFRIVGTSSPDIEERLTSLLSPNTPNLIFADSLDTAELVKAIENCFRFIGISFANELATLFPDFQIRTALKLAGTKWNVEEYQPGIGVGGYCIPLSPKYLEFDPDLNRTVTRSKILSACEDVQQNVYRTVVEFISGAAETSEPDRGELVVLGLSYRADVRGFSCSASERCARLLHDKGWSVKVFEPMMPDGALGEDHFAQLCPISELGDAVRNADAVIIAHQSAHWPDALLRDQLALRDRPVAIVDHDGAAVSLENATKVRYFHPGRPQRAVQGLRLQEQPVYNAARQLARSFASDILATVPADRQPAPQADYLMSVLKAIVAGEEAETPPFQEVLEYCMASHPDETFFPLVAHCHQSAPQFLKGDRSGIQALFAGHGRDIWEASQKKSGLLQHYSAQAASAFEALARDGDRVLEVGGGVGATTRRILAGSAFQRLSRYSFTDVSSYFLTRMQDVAGQGTVDLRLFDLNKPAVEQGFKPASFDIVIATNVLHVLDDPARSIGWLAELLADGGRIIVSEGAPPADHVWPGELVFAFLDQWSARTEEKGAYSGFYEPDYWPRVFASRGFSPVPRHDIAFYSDASLGGVMAYEKAGRA
ncbi:nucleotide sugar dehydrogenase [Roseibium sp.]|uniref:nucleotide sugar dehydrogenase n=1 Tax=Roseibium sp. TaxID=1936156 RepID=UPI003BB008C1